jgi:hypothetical protein
LIVPVPGSPASAANRDDGRSVEVRTDRGSLICRGTREQAEEAVRAGVGRIVGGGKVLRIHRDRSALAWLRNASETVVKERIRVEAAGVSSLVYRHRGQP